MEYIEIKNTTDTDITISKDEATTDLAPGGVIEVPNDNRERVNGMRLFTAFSEDLIKDVAVRWEGSHYPHGKDMGATRDLKGGRVIAREYGRDGFFRTLRELTSEEGYVEQQFGGACEGKTRIHEAKPEWAEDSGRVRK